MPWMLEINMIDVGQGDSSLIVARHTSGLVRAILVDSGKVGYSRTVHNYVSASRVPAVDTIVVSHYDVDHAGGVVGLLSAEVMWDIADGLGALVGQVLNQAPPNANAFVEAVIYRVAAFLAMYGLDNNLPAYEAAIRANPPNVTNYQQAAARAGLITDQIRGGAPLLTNPGIRGQALDAAFGAATAPGVTTVQAMHTAVRDAVVAVLYPQGDPNGMFNTHGLYEDVTVVDLGTGALLAPSDAYINAVGGKVVKPSGTAKRPDGAFTRVYPDLAEEILWGTGPPIAKKDLPAGAPEVYVVARERVVWPNQAVGGIGRDSNLDSIALLLRFNNFWFYTAGDLPSTGENPLADSLARPGANKAPFVPLGGLAAFKCSHHGEHESTSEQFLDATLPAVALISVGKHEDYDHPAITVLRRLEASTMVYGFLTNCEYPRPGIPASFDQDQLDDPDTVFFVAGERSDGNLDAGRVRGDVRLVVLEDATLLDHGDDNRVMVVSYTDTTSGPSRPTHELIDF